MGEEKRLETIELKEEELNSIAGGEEENPLPSHQISCPVCGCTILKVHYSTHVPECKKRHTW